MERHKRIDNVEIKERIDELKEFYRTGTTRRVEYRRAALQRLRKSVVLHTDAICTALHNDLRKSPSESYLSEISIVLGEIDIALRHLKRWSRTKRVGPSLTTFPSRSRIVYEPLGTVLIMAPWNYPLNLTLTPLIGAVAAGNCAVLKPSQTSAHTKDILNILINESFDSSHVILIDTDHSLTSELLNQKFDHIFFTGGADFGREVMMAAARNLTPVTLELGGKSPCIVDCTANLTTAARRVAWGKTFNAGQTCIAPDYIVVHKSIKSQFIELLNKSLKEFYGEDPQQSPNYPRIISLKAFDRLEGYLHGSGTIVGGGRVDRSDKYIEPTVIDGVAFSSPIMQQEIFGPLIPVIEFDDINSVIDHINSHDKPLALYYFGRKKDGMRFIGSTSSGGACINDVMMHITNPRLPFGGVGRSGMGRYHAEETFRTFSNTRSLLISSRHIDNPLRFPPYKSINFLKKFI